MRNRSALCISVAVVALLSLTANAYQLWRGTGHHGNAPITAFFAYADDQAVYALVSRKSHIPELRRTDLAQNNDTDSLRKAIGKESSLRDYPTAAFLVIHNEDRREITNIQARVAWSAEPIVIPVVKPSGFVFVPLDFIRPDENTRSLSVPPEVMISYSEGNDLKITPANTPVRWLDDHFMRGMPPR